MGVDDGADKEIDAYEPDAALLDGLYAGGGGAVDESHSREIDQYLFVAGQACEHLCQRARVGCRQLALDLDQRQAYVLVVLCDLYRHRHPYWQRMCQGTRRGLSIGDAGSRDAYVMSDLGLKRDLVTTYGER